MNTRGPSPRPWLAELVKALGFLTLTGAAVLAWSGHLHPGRLRLLLAHTCDVLAPWFLAALAVAVASAVAVVLRRHQHQGTGWLRAWWRYRRRWAHLMALHGLVVIHRDRVLLPRLQRVVIDRRGIDTLHVVMVPGQAPPDWKVRADALAHAFGAHAARVTVLRPSLLAIELRYLDTLAHPIPLSPARLQHDYRKGAA